jgi:hypothetical protein
MWNVDWVEKKDLSLKFYDGRCVHIDLMFFPEILGVKFSDASKRLGKKFAIRASVVKVYCPPCSTPNSDELIWLTVCNTSVAIYSVTKEEIKL